MRSAIVHDWLVSTAGGGEKVLRAIHQLFPAPVFTLVKDDKKLHGTYFQGLEINTSFIQRLPRAKTNYRSYLPLFPLAIEQFDLSPFDLILSSSHCAAKGIITSPDQMHICYCHTPMRYAWDQMHGYLRESKLDRGIRGVLAKIGLHYLRGWDIYSAQRVDHFIANSKYVAKKIQKFYGRQADVIYPPVDLALYQKEEVKENYYVAASRLVPYKRMDLIVEAFAAMPDKKLVVIGEGPEWKKIRDKTAKNIELLGYQPDPILKTHLQKAKAFVFAAVEDFGILPVEAMACGTPVIAFGKGGVQETVLEGTTGLFFEEQSVRSLIDAVQRFETMTFDPSQCRRRAESFSREQFDAKFRNFVLEKYTEFKS